MWGKSRIVDVDDAGTKLQKILDAANADGTVTIITNHGNPYAAIVPVSMALRQSENLTDLRGSASGFYGEAGEFVQALRNEWS